nr:TatD family hydrolase [uncultured Porphyromonas sp.]
MEAPYIDLHTHHEAAPSAEAWQLISRSLSQGLPPAPPPCSAYSLGIHPWQIDSLGEDALLQLEQALCQAHCLALGEAGLDKRCGTDYSRQQQFLRGQIELSERLQLPLILHLVKGTSELLALRRELRPHMPWVIHGFRGKATEAAQLLGQGLYLSFGRYYHPESLALAHHAGAAFLETDDAPLPIEDIYTEAASALGLPLPELRLQLYERCQSLLTLPPGK